MNSAPPNQKRLQPSLAYSHIKNWLSLFLPLAILATLGLVYLGQNRIDDDIDRLKSEERIAVRLGASSLANELADSFRHLASLPREKPVRLALDAPQPANLEGMEDAFTSLVQRNPRYVYVRWIDESGVERVRINGIDGNVTVVPQQELQFKGRHYFFTDTVKLKPGEFYLSRPDLQIEQGKILLPRKLVLRIATPVQDSAGRPRGILIINILMRSLMNSFIRAADFAASRMMLLNDRGAWLRSPNPDDETAFIMQDGSATFGRRFPAVWKRITENEAGSFLENDELWIWQRATPVTAVATTTVVSNEPPWIAVSHIPAEKIREIKFAAWCQFLPVGSMTLMILAAICWLMLSSKFRAESLQTVVGADHGSVRRYFSIYVFAVLLPICMVLVRQNLPESFGHRPFLLLFIFPITFCALLGGIGPGIVATAAAAIFSNYFLIYPYQRFRITDPYDLFQWILLVANGTLISVLSEGLRLARYQSERQRLKQMETLTRLRDSEARFRELAEHTRDIFWAHEWPNGRVSYVSPAFEAISGIPIEEVYRDNKVWANSVHEEDRDRAQRGFMAGVESGHFELEYRFIRPDGDIRWIEHIGTSIRDNDGRIYRVVGICRDITERKLAELQLHESARRLQIAVQAGKIGLWEWNLQTDQVLYSSVWKAQIGYGELELADTFEEWRSRIHPDDLEPTMQYLKGFVVHAWPDFKMEFRLRHKDGSYRWIFSQGSLLCDQQGEPLHLIGSHTDITERKMTEEALRASELRMTLAQDAAHAGSWEWILENNQTIWSEPLWALYGVGPAQGEASYQTWLMSIHSEDRAAADRVVKTAAAEGKDINVQWRVNLPEDEPERWLMARGRPIIGLDGKAERYIGIAIDISERKQMENELEQHRHHLEELVALRTQELQEVNRILEARAAEIADLYNNAPCGYHSLDGNGMIVAINDTELGWLGYKREEVASRMHFGQFLTPDSLRVFNEKFSQFKASGLVTDREYELVRKDGSVLPIILNATVVRDENGNYLFSRSTLFDNSERKGREAQIASLNAELARRAEEAEAATRAKSSFLANMSHEIRTPMNAVLGFCYLLEQRDLEGETLVLIRKIHAAGQTLLTIINDILDFSKIEAGRLEIERVPFKLSELLDNLASIMSGAARDKDLELVITPPVEVDALIGDCGRLQQVLINLLGNAIKFTASGEVELRVIEESRRQTAVDLRFTVRDTGIGISQEQQAVIFSAFSQADGSIARRFGGTGLGLAICRQLVELMDGSLQVESVFGQGSTFWFVLPFMIDQRVERRPAQLNRLELLVADDSATVRAALTLAATSLGWKVDTADSGESALLQALARADGERFYDALLFDWKMPGLDGLDATKAIREALKEKNKHFETWPVVIMVTSYSHDELLTQSGMAWVDQVLSKPVTPSALYNAVYEALNRRKQGVPAVTHSKRDSVRRQRIPGVRVLVVDDSDINQEVARGILETDGAVVYLACDGQQALDWLQAHPDEVDIVLMDVQMPRLDGYAATRRIREEARWRSLPIVALTAGAFQTLRDAAQESGMNDFISKPFNVDQMMGVIQRWTGCQTEPFSAAFGEIAESDGLYPAAPQSSAIEPTALDLPGIDLPKALDQWGEIGIYRTYLNKFVADYAQAGEIIAAACRQGDLPMAATMAHKLCGVAGSLSLPQVAEIARVLEVLLNRGESAFEQIDELQVAIAEICGTLERWVGAESDSSALDEPSIDSRALEESVPLFIGLLDALDHNDPDQTETWLNRLRDRLNTAQLKEIDALLTDFNFQGAEAAVRNLLRSLNLSIPE